MCEDPNPYSTFETYLAVRRQERLADSDQTTLASTVVDLEAVPAADPVLPNEGVLLDTRDWGPIPTTGTFIDDHELPD